MTSYDINKLLYTIKLAHTRIIAIKKTLKDYKDLVYIDNVMNNYLTFILESENTTTSCIKNIPQFEVYDYIDIKKFKNHLFTKNQLDFSGFSDNILKQCFIIMCKKSSLCDIEIFYNYMISRNILFNDWETCIKIATKSNIDILPFLLEKSNIQEEKDIVYENIINIPDENEKEDKNCSIS